jgi:hypothetical protein
MKAVINMIKLPQFTSKRTFSAEMYLFQKKAENVYDFILGRDLLQEIGIDIINSTRTFRWNEIEAPDGTARILCWSEPNGRDISEICLATRD